MDSFISIYTLGYNPLLLPLFCCSGCYFYSFGHCELFQLSPMCFWHTSSRCVCACPEHSCSLLSYTRWLSSLILCIAWPNTQICHFTKEGSPSYWRMVLGVPGGSDGRESACNTWDLGSIPGLGGSPGGGHGNPLHCSCLKNPHGQRSLAGYHPWGCKELDTTEWLSTHIMEMVYRNQYFYVRCPYHYWMVNFSISQLAEKQTDIHISKYILNTSVSVFLSNYMCLYKAKCQFRLMFPTPIHLHMDHFNLIHLLKWFAL